MKRINCSDSKRVEPKREYTLTELWDGTAPEGVYIDGTLDSYRRVVFKRWGYEREVTVLFVNSFLVETSVKESALSYTLTNEKFTCSFVGGEG